MTLTRSVSSLRFIVPTSTQYALNYIQNGDDVSITDSASLNLGSSYTIFFRAFLRSMGTSNSGRFMDRGSDLWFCNANQGIQIQHNGVGNASDNGLLKIGSWDSYSIVWSGTTFTFYRNGLQYGSTKSTSQALANSGNLHIGNRADGTRYVDGLLKDFFVFNSQALTASQVLDIHFKNYSEGVTFQKKYLFNEGSGSIATDSSGNGLDGTISGATYSQNTQFQPRSAVQNKFLISTSQQKSLSFNSTSSYATVPIVPSTSGFNFSVWLRIKSLANAMRIFDFQDGGPAKGFTLVYETAVPNKISLKINDGSDKTATSPIFQVGRWFNLVGTYKAASNSDFQLYLNTVVGTRSGTLGTMLAPAQTLTLARRATGSSNFSGVDIKNFTFQNTTTPWTQQQITDLYWRNMIPSGATQWSMNNVATDQDGGNALTLTGTSYSTDVPGHMTPRTAV